jgi:hypothetical protein
MLNTVTDAPSCYNAKLLSLPNAGSGLPREGNEATACALSSPSFAHIDDIRTTTKEALDAQLLTRHLQEGMMPSLWHL